MAGACSEWRSWCKRKLTFACPVCETRLRSTSVTLSSGVPCCNNDMVADLSSRLLSALKESSGGIGHCWALRSCDFSKKFGWEWWLQVSRSRLLSKPRLRHFPLRRREYNHESMSEHLTNVMKKQELLLCLLFDPPTFQRCSSCPPNVRH